MFIYYYVTCTHLKHVNKPELVHELYYIETEFICDFIGFRISLWSLAVSENINSFFNILLIIMSQFTASSIA